MNRSLILRVVRVLPAVMAGALILAIGLMCLEANHYAQLAASITTPLTNIHALEESLDKASQANPGVTCEIDLRTRHALYDNASRELNEVSRFAALNRLTDFSTELGSANGLLLEIRDDIRIMKGELEGSRESNLQTATSEVMDDIRQLELGLYSVQSSSAALSNRYLLLIQFCTFLSLIMLAASYYAGAKLIRKLGNKRASLLRRWRRFRRAMGLIQMKIEYAELSLNQVSDAIEWLDATGRIVYVNNAACRQTGYSREELLEMHLWDLAPTRRRDTWPHVWSSLKQQRNRIVQSVHRRKSGEDYPVEVSVSYHIAKGQELMISSVSDTSKLEFARENLEEMRRGYRELHETVDVGIGLVDSDERFVFANRAAHEIFGLSNDGLRGRTLREFMSAEEFARCRTETSKREGGESTTYELEITRPSGEKRLILLTAKPRMIDGSAFIGTFGVFRDITDERRLSLEHAQMEGRLNRAEKMEALGLLAGGVAHDLNNMLSPLVGYPEMILRKLPSDSPVRKWVEKMEKSAEQAADVISDLLTMARRGRYQMKATSVNDVIRDFVDSPGFARTMQRNPGVALTTNLDESVPTINGSAAHLTKVCMNVITNAFEATSAGGSVAVTTYMCHLSRLSNGYDEIVAGDYVAVKVKDTGMGISPEDISKIFQPYFSKKKMGASGSGLGLAVVYGVVKDHGGYYDIISEVGKGTEFLLYFPVSPTACATDKPHDSVDLSGLRAVVISDDQEVRELTGLMLENLGLSFGIVECSEGGACLQTAEFDIAIVDVPLEKYSFIESKLTELRKGGARKPVVCLVDRMDTSERDFMPDAAPVIPVRKPAKTSVLGEAIQAAIRSSASISAVEGQSEMASVAPTATHDCCK